MSKQITLSLLLIIMVIGCKRKEDTSWDVDVVSPVVKTTLTLDDLLPDSNITINGDNSVDIDYRASLSPLDDNYFLKIPDTSLLLRYGFPFSSPVSVPPGFQFVNDPSKNKFNLRDSKIEFMKIKSGEIFYKIISQVNEKTFYTLEILKTDDGNGNNFKKTIEIPPGTRTSPSVTSGTFYVSNYLFDLRGDDGKQYNTFESVISIHTDPAGNPVTVSNQDSVFIENKLLFFTPEFAKGYLGKVSTEEGPTDNIFSIFDPIVSGSIDLDSVNIYTEIKNYIGAEAQATIKQLISKNSTTGFNVSLTHSSINSKTNLPRATENYNGITPSVHRIEYTKANSNIDLFVENLPNFISSQLKATLNPLGNVSSSNDFIYFNKLIEADFHINFPLRLIANDLVFRQKLNLNINKENNPVNNALLSIYAENGYPFDAKVELFLMDVTGNIVDSLWLSGIINSANTNATNFVTSPTNSVVKYAIPKEKMAIINANSEVLLQITFNTNSSSHTTIYSDYYMKLKLVTDMNATVKYR